MVGSAQTPSPDSSNNQSGLLLIISGPSGVGKTTITHKVKDATNGRFSVSMTTRAPAAGDREGEDYHFVDQMTFNKTRDAGELLEWAEVYPGCSYGTPRQPVEQAVASGELMILEIDVEGAIQVKKQMEHAYAMFVLPPNENVLLERLRARARDDEAAIARRFAKAKAEINKAWDCGIYDDFIVNRDLNRAVDEAVALVQTRLSA